MNIEQHIETLLHGGKVEARQAKSALKKELEKRLRPSWKTKEQFKEDRKTFSQEMLCIYGKLFDGYEQSKNHNKCAVLSFLSHALFYFENSYEYFETFLAYVREALQNEVDGNIRHVAVMTASNTYTVGIMWSSVEGTRMSEHQKKISEMYQKLIRQHVTAIFDLLETHIEKNEVDFPEAIEYMKPSIVKSHLLYVFDFDRFDTLFDLSGMYEESSVYENNEYYKMWYAFYKPLLQECPHIKKFIKHVPRFDLHKHEEYEYESSDIPEMVQEILNRSEMDDIIESPFPFGKNSQNQEVVFEDFSIPKDSYFEIWELLQDVDDPADLFAMFNIIYKHVWHAPVSEIYWYDLVDSVLSKYNDIPLRLKILEEALKKLSSKVAVHVPIDEEGKNAIHYGIHEHRPIFRILIAYALYHHDIGDKKIAKEYYSFLLKLNPGDNQGVRYVLAALHAGKPSSYTDGLFDEGNRTQNWDKVENFLNEQNAKHHFWDEPK